MKEGDRVQLNITDREPWAFGTVDKINGRSGFIEKIRPLEHTFFAEGRTVLVQFDEPIPDEFSGELTGFWMLPEELTFL